MFSTPSFVVQQYLNKLMRIFFRIENYLRKKKVNVRRAISRAAAATRKLVKAQNLYHAAIQKSFDENMTRRIVFGFR